MRTIIGAAAALTALAGFLTGGGDAFAAAETVDAFSSPSLDGVGLAGLALGVTGLGTALSPLGRARAGEGARAFAVLELALGGTVAAIAARSAVENPASGVGVVSVMLVVGAVWAAASLVLHWYHG